MVATPSSYENAPATRMLATNCLCCGRALVDAVSVETGIGPVCREKYGYAAHVSDAARKAANELVHEAALTGTTVARRLEISQRIRVLGFMVLADKIDERFGKDPVIKITEIENGGGLLVCTPYNEAYLADFKAAVFSQDRSWQAAQKGWLVSPRVPKRILFALLSKHFGGEPATGPKGLFILPVAS